jgi:hypothetical protein
MQICLTSQIRRLAVNLANQCSGAQVWHDPASTVVSLGKRQQYTSAA